MDRKLPKTFERLFYPSDTKRTSDETMVNYVARKRVLFKELVKHVALHAWPRESLSSTTMLGTQSRAGRNVPTSVRRCAINFGSWNVHHRQEKVAIGLIE